MSVRNSVFLRRCSAHLRTFVGTTNWAPYWEYRPCGRRGLDGRFFRNGHWLPSRPKIGAPDQATDRLCGHGVHHSRLGAISAWIVVDGRLVRHHGPPSIAGAGGSNRYALVILLWPVAS